MKRLNKRRYDRLPSSAPIAFRWRDDSGETHFGHGTVLDYSRQGLRVELLEPIQFPSFVLVGSQGRNKKACAGKVRYCETKQTKYIVGLDLTLTAQSVDPGATEPDLTEVVQNPEFSMLMFRP